MGSPLSTVPPWYSVEDDWTPPPFLCSPGKHVIPTKIFWRPHSQVISNDWFPKRRSCSAATIRERGSGSERNCYAWQQLPYNRPTAHLSLTTNATWLNSITTKLINRFAWARPKKLNFLFHNSLFHIDDGFCSGYWILVTRSLTTFLSRKLIDRSNYTIDCFSRLRNIFCKYFDITISKFTLLTSVRWKFFSETSVNFCSHSHILSARDDS